MSVRVTIDVDNPAGFWVRIAANLIDFSICAFILAIYFYFYIFVEGEKLVGLVLLLSCGWVVLVPVSYFTVQIATWPTTLGKRMFGLYVARADGSRIGPFRALGRSLAMVTMAYIVACWGILLALIFRGEERTRDYRSAPDLLCDTVVARRKGQDEFQRH